MPLTVVVGYLQAGTHVAIMVTLSCFVFLRALYTAHFGLMNRVSDATILRVIQLVSIATSFIVHGIEIGHKVAKRVHNLYAKNILFLVQKRDISFEQDESVSVPGRTKG